MIEARKSVDDLDLVDTSAQTLLTWHKPAHTMCNSFDTEVSQLMRNIFVTPLCLIFLLGIHFPVLLALHQGIFDPTFSQPYVDTLNFWDFL